MMSSVFRTPALVVVLAGIVAALHVGKVPPAIPVLRDAMGLTLLQAGFLLAALQLAGMVAGVWVGLAAGRVGLRRSMLVGLCLLALASFLGGWMQSAVGLLLCRAVEGFGFLLVVLPAPGMIRLLVPPERLSVKLGFWGSYMPAGTALALVSGAWAMTYLGWRGWWWMLAGITVAMALWLARAIPADVLLRARAGGPSLLPAERVMQLLRRTLSARGPWLVAITFALYSSQWLAVIGFLPSIFALAGVGASAAGALTALASIVNVIGNVAAGRLLQRGVLPRRLLQSGFLAMAAGTFLAFSNFNETSPVLRYLAVLLFSAVGGVIPAVLFTLAVRLAPSEQTIPATVGWVQQLSALGQFAGPPLVASVAALTGGWNWTWTITGSASLLGMLLANWLRVPDKPAASIHSSL